jgi:hypothetical protein
MSEPPSNTPPAPGDAIPSTLQRPGAARFWLAVLLTGVGTGMGAAALTRLLEVVQHLAWNGSGTNILDAAEHAGVWRHILVLLGAGLVTGAGQIILRQLSSGNGIDTTAAIWFHAGRMPALRTLGSAVLSVLDVGMGVSLGREGAPKQAGAVIANFFSDRERLSDEQRRLLVACGAGAGMGAAYGVPLGGALFALEVMRGRLALRYVLPAIFASVIATAVSWLALPDAPTYIIPAYSSSASCVVWALLVGPIAGVVSVGYVRIISWADRNRPKGWRRFGGTVTRTGAAWGRLNLVPASARQWQGHLPVGIHEPSGADVAVDAASAEARRHRVVHAQRRARRFVHTFANGRRIAGRRSRPRLVLALARCSPWTVRDTRSWSCSGSNHTRPNLNSGSDDGIDWPLPIVHLAAAAGSWYRNACCADHRTSIDLRRTPDR